MVEKIANVGYLEKKQIFVKAITYTKLSGSVWLPKDTPGYLRTPKVTPK